MPANGLEELIPAHPIVRVVNDSYHPKMMTKIIVYAYTQKIYFSRQIAKAVREYVPFMWISARAESVFGKIKNNRGFRRFLLRGLPKVSLEVVWLPLAHNLLKKAAIGEKRRTVGQE